MLDEVSPKSHGTWVLIKNLLLSSLLVKPKGSITASGSPQLCQPLLVDKALLDIVCQAAPRPPTEAGKQQVSCACI